MDIVINISIEMYKWEKYFSFEPFSPERISIEKSKRNKSGLLGGPLDAISIIPQTCNLRLSITR